MNLKRQGRQAWADMDFAGHPERPPPLHHQVPLVIALQGGERIWERVRQVWDDLGQVGDD